MRADPPPGMEIEFKLFASLARYLPPGGRANTARIQVPEGASVAEVLAGSGVPAEEIHLVILNGIFIAPEEREHRFLKEGDTLAIWPPVAGG